MPSVLHTYVRYLGSVSRYHTYANMSDRDSVESGVDHRNFPMGGGPEDRIEQTTIRASILLLDLPLRLSTLEVSQRIELSLCHPA